MYFALYNIEVTRVTPRRTGVFRAYSETMANYQQNAMPAFHNVEPMGREERLAAQGGDRLEKNRLRQKGIDAPSNPIIPVKDSPQYVDEYQRFQRDAAAQEYQRRQADINRREGMYEGRRVESYYREKSRWDHMEHSNNQHEQHLQHKRDNAAGGQRNQSGEHYNILTLEHRATPGGERLRQQDQGIVHRADARAQNLYSKSTSVTHNIITGQPIQYPRPGQY